MAVAKAFAITSMPFVLAEAGTGVISLLTAELSIPPVLGIAMAVDLTILLTGLAATVLRATKTKSSRAEVPEDPESG